MGRRIDDPVALAQVRWHLDQAPPPQPGGVVASTAVFVLGGDEEVIPDWPAGGEHFSVMLELVGPVSDDGRARAKVDFLDRSGVAERLQEGARFLFMAGRRALADVELTKVLANPGDWQ